MPKLTQERIEFGRLGRRVIEADFSGGDLSSDGGLLLRAAAALSAPPDAERVRPGCASC